MTFEEFFTKKRINLALLRQAKPDLYEEFRLHYAQMGEKSFDHTKKYWFNRLRKDFLLAVTEKPKTVPVAAAVTAAKGSPSAMTTETKPTGLSSMSPSGFKPRFKAGTTLASKPVEQRAAAVSDSSKNTNTTPATDDQPAAPSTKPPGFKPRFKSGVTTSTKAATDTPASAGDNTQPDEAESPSKPLGFKPRFKAGVTAVKKPADDETPKLAAPQSTPEPPTETTPKPLGFKPRFKAGKTTNKKDDDAT